MGKREKARRMKKEGLHEIKNKYRTRAVKKRRKGLVLAAKKKRRALRACTSLSAIFLLFLGAFAIGSAFLSAVVPNAVPDDFVTVSYELPDDGSKPTEHSALENIGYMNYRFKHQPSWYMEMHGSTIAAGMNQSVNTFKQYSDGVLIMEDVTSSAMINAGRQFCYVGDEVMWREIPKNGSFKANSYEEAMRLVFKDELKAHMTISAFKEKNGLPGTELTVYIINEETLDHASEAELVSSADWDGVDNVEKPVYKQTYYLRAGDSENLGAAAHYANQMAFTGGLTGLPEFNYIRVTFTFDSSWQVLRTEIDESYKATMGISVTCTSSFASDYEYGTERAKNDVYDKFFKDFVGKGIEDNVEKPLDSLNCITSAFLTRPVTYELNLEADGKKTNGVISLDASKLDIAKIMNGGSVDIGAALGSIGLKARIGDILIYLEDSTAYLAVGGLKAKLPIDKLLSMITGGAAQPAAEESESSEGGEEASVFDLGDPVLEEKDGVSYATVLAKLDLTSLGADLVMPLSFKFKLDEEKNASLETLDLSLTYQGVDARVGLKSTDKSVPALTDKDSFIDLYPYAEAVYSLVSGGKLEIELDYANKDMTLSGNIGLDFVSGFKLAGALTLNVRGSAKTVEIAILDGVAYLNLDGIRISASLSDALNLVKGFLPAAGNSDSDELKRIVDTALSALFDNDLASLFTLGDEENALTLGVKGTELLSAFGVDFALGDINLNIDKTNGAIAASAYGANVSVKALEKEITFDTEGYTELTEYAQTFIKLFTGETLTAEVSYENELGGKALAIGGNITVGLSPLSVSGEITVAFGALEKSVEIVYGEDGYLYLVLDSLKVKANTKEAISVISSLISKGEEEEADVYEILEKALSVNFGEILSIFETTEGELNAVIGGTKLLSLLGVNFDLGDITLTVGADRVSVSALGANLALTAGGNVKVLSDAEKAAYVDLKPVLDALPEILNKKALSLGGKLVLNTGDIDVLLSLDNGVISFANGFEAYFELSLVMREATVDLELYIDTSRVKLALGSFGAEIAFAELSSLGEAVASLYEEVRKTLNPISEKELLPEAKTIEDIFNLLSSLLPESDEAGIDGILSQLSIENSKEKNGLLAVKFMGVSLDIIKEKDGFIGAKVRFANDSLSVEGSLSAAVYAGTMPAMPAIGYLGTDDFVELLDYLAAAVHTLAESNINLTVSGVIGSDDEKYPDGVKYNLSGDIRLYSGETTAVHLELDKKSLWVDSEIYVYADVALAPVLEGDKGLYLEFFLLDCDEDGNQDGILDLFVSVSFFGEGDTRRNPFTLYAPVSEIMPLLSSALALFGVDIDIVNDYVLAPWLSAETTAQLKGFGQSFKPLLSGLLGSAEETEKTAFDVNALISSIKVGDKSFSLALDSKTIFGKEGEPLKITIGKEKTENGSRLSSLAVENIGNTTISVKLGYENRDEITPAFKGSICLNGIASLLQTIARSTTHPVDGEVISGEETKHEYALNKNFYIDGSIQLDVSVIGMINAKLDIKLVAFSITIDEEGVWGVNVRFEYDAVKLAGITAINGNTQVDLTGKDNMFYIKRVQTTDADKKPFAKPIVLYRAMPLNNFVNDLIDQAAFMFNLGSIITDNLPSDMGGGNTQKEAVDLGTTVSKFLKSLDYTSGENGEKWVVTLNGAGLTNNTLGDIIVSLGSDGEGKLRTLTAHTSLSTTGVSIKIDANLTYRNPCGVMDEGVKDITTDIAELLTDGMSYKLKTVDWTKTDFIEGEFTSVDYILVGTLIKTQDIVISTGAAGDAKGTVYGTLAYPDLAPYNAEKGYKAEWDKVYDRDEALPENKQIFASYRPLTYELTFNFEDGESETLAYEYGDKEFALPFRENESTRVAYFTDGEGGVYRTAEDLTAIEGNTTLTAVYERVEYTVTFVVDGERTEQNAYYGDAVVYPASPEKAGYTFAGWDISPETVTENLEITALWTANEYAVTLVSKYETEGFAWTLNESGSYSVTFTFVYDSKVSLPRGVKYEDGDEVYVLRGFCTGAGDICYFDYLPNVTENTVFTAQWQELGFDIVFTARDGSKTVLNYHSGDVIESSAIPAIAERNGYTSFWQDEKGNLLTGDYRVTGEAAFTVADVANTYTVTLVSSLPYAGFNAANGVYTKTLSYTYGGAAVALDTPGDISGYWFKGYYTAADGEGEKLESVAGILEDTTLYVYWQDNTVTVRVYSDLRFEGSVQDFAKNGYYKEYSFNDIYDVSDAMIPTAEGYQTLALFHLGESWEKVDNVRNLNGADLWVFWIRNINVKITEFYTNNVAGGSAYNIGGTIEGALPFGKMSNLIYDELNMSEHTTTEATFYIRGASESDSVDNCGGKKTITVSYENGSIVGSFLGQNMNSWDYRDIWPAPRATYGGVVITKTFEYGGKTISTTNGAMVSLDTYTVTYVVNGVETNVGGVRIDCPFDEYDCRVFVDEIAAENGIDVPEKEGYAGAWPHEEVRGDMTVTSGYTPKAYLVRFESEQRIEGWTEENGKYIYECEMDYDASIVFYYENELLASNTVGKVNNVVVPVLADTQKWGAIEIAAGSARFYAQRNVDTVVYNSEVPFDFDGVLYDSLLHEVTDGYSPITPTASGYTFLGWYRNVNGVWEKVTAVYPTEGEEKVSISVQALWVSDLKVEITRNDWSGNIFSQFDYRTDVKVTGGKLVGAPASEIGDGTLDYRFYVSKKDNYDSSASNETASASYNGEEATRGFYCHTGSYNYGHVVVNLSYEYNGEVFRIGNDLGNETGVHVSQKY